MSNTNQNKLTSLGFYSHYAKREYWTKEEAVALSFGIDPRKIRLTNGRLGNDQGDYYNKNFCAKYDELMELLDRAIKILGLPSKRQQASIYSNDGFVMGFSPLDFTQWAKRKEIELPKELEELVIKYNISKNIDWEAKYKALEIESNKDKEEKLELINENARLLANNTKLTEIANEKLLHGSEKKSIFSFLGVMIAVAYTTEDFINEKVKVAEMQKDFQDRGVEMDRKTITKHLKASYAALKGIIYKKSN